MRRHRLQYMEGTSATVEIAHGGYSRVPHSSESMSDSTLSTMVYIVQPVRAMYRALSATYVPHKGRATLTPWRRYLAHERVVRYRGSVPTLPTLAPGHTSLALWGTRRAAEGRRIDYMRRELRAMRLRESLRRVRADRSPVLAPIVPDWTTWELMEAKSVTERRKLRERNEAGNPLIVHVDAPGYMVALERLHRDYRDRTAIITSAMRDEGQAGRPTVSGGIRAPSSVSGAEVRAAERWTASRPRDVIDGATGEPIDTTVYRLVSACRVADRSEYVDRIPLVRATTARRRKDDAAEKGRAVLAAQSARDHAATLRAMVSADDRAALAAGIA